MDFDSPEIKALIRQRGNVKARLTRLKTFVDEFDVTKPLSSLSVRVNNLDNCWTEYDRFQSQLEELLCDNELYIELIEDRNSFEDKYYETKACIHDHLSVQTVTVNDSLPLTVSTIKLPTIELPTFSGSYEEWQQYYDTFYSLIDNNNSLNNIQKFHYLKASLKGGALEVIHSLEVSSANYSTAWELLTSRFANKRIIISKHIQALFDLPKLHCETITSLRPLVDNLQKHIRALTTLGEPTQHWDTLLIFIVTNKFDYNTRRLWETHSASLPEVKYKDLIQFLNVRCNILEACDVSQEQLSNKQAPKTHSKQLQQSQSSVPSCVSASTQVKCIFCNHPHSLSQCNKFIALSTEDRISKARDLHVCLNCLRFGHQALQCKNPGTCKRCHKRHHSLLHLGEYTISTTEPVKRTVTTCTQGSGDVVLATAQVLIANCSGELFPCRVLLDSGSQSHFMTESMAQSLGLRRHKQQTPILGINKQSSTAFHTVQTTIKSQFNGYKAKLQFLVMNKITGELPLYKVDLSSWNVPTGIKLADPQFNMPRGIDALLGAEIFFELLCIGQIKLGENCPIIQKTLLGWVVTGRVPRSTQSPQTPPTVCHLSQQTKVDDLLAAFWKIEDCTFPPKLSKQELECEKHYISNFHRASDGRFVVQLPFSQDPRCLGNSKDQAVKRFKNLERRLSADHNLKAQYCDFLDEYQKLGHMEKVQVEDNTDHCYYLPHHPVIKASSSTTKLRVVFDASAKSSSGLSLNDILMIGPTIQRDLFSIVLSFRMHAYVFTTDIKQMYRQILIDSSQTNYQRIVWRNNPDEELQTYRLTTVTYGTAAAPFLAIRSLKQLAEDEKLKYPLATEIARRDFYVDDMLTGSDSLDTALQMQSELIDMLRLGGFELRKWCANNTALLENIPPDHRDQYYAIETQDDNATIKALGIHWQPTSDTFQYKVSLPEKPGSVTKRSILSDTSRLFDPLGLVAPVIVVAKIIMQQLWQLNISWDESVPSHLQTTWLRYRSRLFELNDLSVKRRVTQGTDISSIELHGFSDASESSYGACIYIRCEHSNGEISSNLLCAKSRVAPLKKISLPRLELCGALMLAQLASKVADSFNQHCIKSTFLWTDSTIVLHWLAATPNKWKTFVANRVSEIQDLTNQCNWRHVRSADNPADILSRGATPNQLIDSTLWWFGPSWMSQSCQKWPNTCIKSDTHSSDQLEERKQVVIACPVSQDQLDSLNLESRYSCWYKLTRITAFCKRFSKNTRLRPDQRSVGPLTVPELQEAEYHWLTSAQQMYFVDELKSLKKSNQVKPSSKLRTLSPFIDLKGLIRVGGRLKNSEMDYNNKHPILLPQEHVITTLIIQREHIKSLHAGPQALLARIRTRYWPINGKILIRRVIRNCVNCFKVNPRNSHQLMGNLPNYRVQPSRPFLNCGVDYCGPIYARKMFHRRSTPVKTYIALFICMATKAIHLELIMDLSTAACLAAFKRFISRRGKPTNIFCDNATTFVGANNELSKLKSLFLSQAYQQDVARMLAEEQITWKFIPARSPHFGGLWEAGVKTVKGHLKRMIGNAQLQFDELITLLCQIEACVNSRPITALSSNPNDLLPLTPAHFLISDNFSAPVEPDLTSLTTNRLSRWQRGQQLLQIFWRRYSSEYLSSLQQRHKWHTKGSNLSPDSLVLIKEDFRPPLYWETGRVVDLYPGADGIARVATVKTARGLFKRAINKLCPLPTN